MADEYMSDHLARVRRVVPVKEQLQTWVDVLRSSMTGSIRDRAERELAKAGLKVEQGEVVRIDAE